MYHNVVPDDCPIDAWTLVRARAFWRQMELLKRSYDVIKVEDLIDRSEAKPQFSRKSCKPQAVITFDDGYKNNYSVALPILKAFGLPATVFICSGFINNPEMAWYDKVIYAIQRSECNWIEVDKQFYTFKDRRRNRRWDMINALLTDLKARPTDERLRLVRAIEEDLRPAYDRNECFAFLSDRDIKEMHATGLITIGAHTANHEILTQLSEDEARGTILRSSHDLRNIIDHEVTVISYPNGNYNAMVLGLMRESSFKAAFTTKDDLYSREYDRYEIPRIGIGGYDDDWDFIIKTSGIKQMIAQ